MICVNETWYQVLVVLFWVWQITSSIYGLFWLVILFRFKYLQHKEHVQQVEDNHYLIMSIINELEMTYVPRHCERQPYVLKKRNKR